jgi:hypothetical protein
LAEAIAVLKAAFSSETFSFTGQHSVVRHSFMTVE